MIIRTFLLLRTKIKSLFLRSIAFSARVEYSQVSKKAKVWRKARLFHSSIGAYSYVGPGSRVIHANIGKFCSISDAIIGMGSHPLTNIATSSLFTEKRNGTGYSWVKRSHFDEFKTINIGNDVWIGTRAIIMGGVNIGNGTVVGAGAIVTHDVPPYAIVAGVPAKIIRYRFPQEVIDKLEEAKWWDLPVEELKKHIGLFQKDNITDDEISKIKQLCDNTLKFSQLTHSGGGYELGLIYSRILYGSSCRAFSYNGWGLAA